MPVIVKFNNAKLSYATKSHVTCYILKDQPVRLIKTIRIEKRTTNMKKLFISTVKNDGESYRIDIYPEALLEVLKGIRKIKKHDTDE